MAVYQGKYYEHKPEIWDATKCEKMAKRVARDGMGCKYPFKGYIGCTFGRQRHNGGCTRDGDWYEGEVFPFPTVADGFEIILVPTWGYRIRKIGAE